MRYLFYSATNIDKIYTFSVQAISGLPTSYDIIAVSSPCIGPVVSQAIGSGNSAIACAVRADQYSFPSLSNVVYEVVANYDPSFGKLLLKGYANGVLQATSQNQSSGFIFCVII
jgi:hypothetical protein